MAPYGCDGVISVVTFITCADAKLDAPGIGRSGTKGCRLLPGKGGEGLAREAISASSDTPPLGRFGAAAGLSAAGGARKAL